MSTVRVSRRTRKTNVHDAIVPVATLIGVDWSIPEKLDESARKTRDIRLLPTHAYSSKLQWRPKVLHVP